MCYLTLMLNTSLLHQILVERKVRFVCSKLNSKVCTLFAFTIVVVLSDPLRGIGARNVSPPHRCGAVPAPLSSGGSKWRGNFSEGSGHPITPNRLLSQSFLTLFYMFRLVTNHYQISFVLSLMQCILAIIESAFIYDQWRSKEGGG